MFPLCKKAGRKLSVLSRLSNLMSFQQRRLLIKSFVEAQFGCCPLVWMFMVQKINRKINHIHERSQRIFYRDYNSSFKDQLKKDKSVGIHHRNIQSLAVELFKVKENISNTIINDIFPTRLLNYSLRSQTDFFRNTINTAKYVLNSLRYFASKVWNMIPTEIKTLRLLKCLKISKWEPNDCDWKLCQYYLYRIGYVVNLVDD